MSRTSAIDGAIGALHGGRLAQRWSAVRARVAGGRLDSELANGADPWSSRSLLLRAARMSSLAERRKLAAGLTVLVGQARRSTSFDASPVYVGGRPPEELMRVIARALQELDLA